VTDRVDVACLKPSLVRVLKTIESHYGKSIVVTSGYRSPPVNRKARGARNSLHMYCAAADVQVPAAVEMADRDEEDGASVLLLGDLAAIFSDRGEHALPTKDLIDALHSMEERPWAEFKRGKPLSAPQLAAAMAGVGVAVRRIGRPR
jgi:hypothetical protein